MKPQTDQTRWKMLERNAHRADVQELIRHEIQSGTIRVVPGLNGGIRIVPTRPEPKATIPPGESGRYPPDAGLTVG